MNFTSTTRRPWNLDKRENFVEALTKFRVSIIVDLHQLTSSKQTVGGSDGDAPYLTHTGPTILV
jgi:hypothetical protein